MDDELCQDEERHRDEKARVCFCVEEKRDLDLSAQCHALPQREQQQREPRDQYAGENAAMDQREGIIGEVRPAKQLVDRATQHEGEVGRLRSRPLRARTIDHRGGHDCAVGGNWALAAATTFSTVKPYSVSRAFNGAEAPKVCMAMTRPVWPT